MVRDEISCWKIFTIVYLFWTSAIIVSESVNFTPSLRDFERNFKWTFMQRRQYPIHNCNLNLYLITKLVRNFRFSRFIRVRFWLSLCIPAVEIRKSLFVQKPLIKIISFQNYKYGRVINTLQLKLPSLNWFSLKLLEITLQSL